MWKYYAVIKDEDELMVDMDGGFYNYETAESSMIDLIEGHDGESGYHGEYGYYGEVQKRYVI